MNIKQRVFVFVLITYWAAPNAWATPAELVDAALKRTMEKVTYNGKYVAIPYPNGDVPSSIGVCTDLVIRSYRALNIDLQQRVHEDMTAHFNAYPSKRIWNLNKPDSNIDHRRVPNLRTYFTRHGESFSVSNAPSQFLAGDIVSWRLPGNLPHIGIVSKNKTPQGAPLVIHNIGSGPKEEDALFKYEITGHYRYF